MRLSAITFTCLLLTVPAGASDPGDPLDCTDWVILEPGLSCGYWIEYPCQRSECAGWIGHSDMDNDGRLFEISTEILPGGPPNLKRWNLSVFDGTTTTVLAYIDERIRPDGQIDSLTSVPENLLFYELEGKLQLARLNSVCLSNPPEFCTNDYGSVPWVPVFSGFTTLFEILQTYDPPAPQLGFRVPAMPEGFEAADWFDTYWGELAAVGDWSQARPLQCGYPPQPPQQGDYVTVADTLPTPDVGQGYFYVTAVQYQGQRRYGRQAASGLHSGRDPALLPACE